MHCFFFPHHLKKKTWLSPSENFVKNKIACLVRIVLCELRLGWWSRSMSSHSHCLLLSFTFLFFCNIFSETFSLCHFPMSIFHNVENTIEKWEHNIFLFCKKKNFVCALYCWNLSSLDSFFDFSKTKQISFRFFKPKCCKNKFLCLKILLRKFSPKKIWQKQFFLFGRIFLFSFFYSLPFKKSIFANKKKPDSLYFSLYCFCLICCLFRVVSLCLLSLLLLF